MAKVRQDTAAGGGKKEKNKEKESDKEKKPGRNDLVNETTKDGTATFKFAEPMMETRDFTSYNGGKGTHAFCVVRNDGQKFKSGRTGLKYLKHADGKTLFEHVASQAKRGRPAKKKESDPDASQESDATVPAAPDPRDLAEPAAAGEPVAAGVVEGKSVGNDPFGFMDDDKAKE